MQGYNFTDGVRKGLAAARDEAFRLGHEYVGPDHIALGLLRVRDPVVLGVLTRLAVDADDLQRAVADRMPASAQPPEGPDLPYTARAKKVLERAMSEAREAHAHAVATVHLLVAVMRDEDSFTHAALRSRRIGLEALRAEAARAEPEDTAQGGVFRRSTGYNFSERARKALRDARAEATGLRHEYVGTEHILLAIVRAESGVAREALLRLNVDLAAIIRQVEETVKAGRSALATGPDLPYTSRAKTVLELAIAEATDLQHSVVDTEHLLLGLLREGKGIAAQALQHAGVRLDELRTTIVQLRGAEPQAAASPEGQPTAALPHRTAPGDARLDLARLQAEVADEERMWSRLRNALDLCESLGTVPRLTRRADGSVEVRVTDQLAVVIPRLPGLEPVSEPPAPGA